MDLVIIIKNRELKHKDSFALPVHWRVLPHVRIGRHTSFVCLPGSRVRPMVKFLHSATEKKSQVATVRPAVGGRGGGSE